MENILRKIGISHSEAKVYMALIALGSTTTGPIMTKAKVSSSKIYGILNKLIEKGLVSFILKERTKYFQAADPKALLSYQEEREKMMKKESEELALLIPKLQKKTSPSQNAQFYLGVKGITSAFHSIIETLNPGEEYLAFSQTTMEEEHEKSIHFFERFQKKREQKKIRTKLIAPISQKPIFTRAPYINFKKFDVRYLPSTPPGIVIFDQNILIANMLERTAIVISSSAITNAYRTYFNQMWGIATP